MNEVRPRRVSLRAPLTQLRRRICLSLCIGALFGWSASGRAAEYTFALSPNGSRFAIFKRDSVRDAPQLFEGPVAGPTSHVEAPALQEYTGTAAYRADGTSLYFETKPQYARAKAADTQRAESTLWARELKVGATATPVIRSAGIANLLPLKDGALVFLSATRTVRGENPLPRPATPSIRRVIYHWLLLPPNDTLPRDLGAEEWMFPQAFLVKDQTIAMVSPLRHGFPDSYELRSVTISGSADVGRLASLVRGLRGNDLRLQCDWTAETCALVTAAMKNGFYAHRLRIIRRGDSCEVAGLPDRLERLEVSRDGSAIALLTRPSPRPSAEYQLAYLRTTAAGCEYQLSFHALP